MKAKNVENRQDYYQYVEEMADIFIDEKVNEDLSDIHYEISLEVDQCRMHMMYGNNLKVLQYSDSEPEEWQIYVEENETNYRKVLQAMTYATLRRDLIEELQDRIDFNKYA